MDNLFNKDQIKLIFNRINKYNNEKISFSEFENYFVFKNMSKITSLENTEYKLTKNQSFNSTGLSFVSNKYNNLSQSFLSKSILSNFSNLNLSNFNNLKKKEDYYIEEDMALFFYNDLILILKDLEEKKQYFKNDLNFNFEELFCKLSDEYNMITKDSLKIGLNNLNIYPTTKEIDLLFWSYSQPNQRYLK